MWKYLKTQMSIKAWTFTINEGATDDSSYFVAAIGSFLHKDNVTTMTDIKDRKLLLDISFLEI